MEPGTLRLGRRDQALLDELRRATFVTDSELCLVAIHGNSGSSIAVFQVSRAR